MSCTCEALGAPQKHALCLCGAHCHIDNLCMALGSVLGLVVWQRRLGGTFTGDKPEMGLVFGSHAMHIQGGR